MSGARARDTSTESSKSNTTDDLDFTKLNISSIPKEKARRTLNYSYPQVSPRLCKSENNSSCYSCRSDSSVSDGKFVKCKRRKRRYGRNLPPLGIFWDIENCHVPKNKSAVSFVHKLRELFLVNYREAEFLVVCDVKKENAQLIQDLNDTQVNLIHVSSICKNAADEKLRQSLRRFAEVHPAPSAVILISSDVNFAADLSDLRYRRKIHVILIHNTNVADALILCANETYSFVQIADDLPVRGANEKQQFPVDLLICNLPENTDKNKVRNRLKLLTDNCGGRVINIVPEKGIATVRFCSLDFAVRAQRRIQGEDVFGNKIKVLNPSLAARDSPVRNYAGRRVKNHDLSSYQQYSGQTSGLLDSSRQSQYFSGSAPNSTGKFTQDAFCNLPKVPIPFNAKPMDIDVAGWKPLPMPTNNTSGIQQNYRTGINGSAPVDLFISNLDPNMDIRELRKILVNMIKEHVMVLSLNITVQADGNPVANLKVATQQEAQYVISQMHRQKLGYKRIVISYQSNVADPHQLRAMVITLLQEAPGKSMPLFKLLELLETRYHSNVSTSEVNKLKDICKITGDARGRIVTLTPELCASPPPNLSLVLTPYCTVHCPNGLESRGWGEADNTKVPHVMMPLKLFGEKVIGLLTSHMGAIPLLSFRVCYEIEYGEPLPTNSEGVHLEHLLSCVNSVTLKYGGPNKNIKYIKREITPGEPEELEKVTLPASLAPNLNLLCREVVDLLKTMDRCQLLWSRFIPAYHHHFGRQCRVADYGCTKLIDLFEAIPHVVQLMGDVSRRIITLSHAAQMRRFTSDLLRILKSQASKQLPVYEFATAYERIFGKVFSAIQYGLCSLEDLLEEVPQNTVVISRAENRGPLIISIPKREQTAEEMTWTKQFGQEVIQLLCHSPHHSMLFNKFVPAYHHHFGYQCRVSNYGFTKLIELFEAISDVVKIEELPDGERQVSLTLPQALDVVGKQIKTLIENTKSNLALEDLPAVYLRQYGYPLKPQTYECETVLELINKLYEVIEILHSPGGPLLILNGVESGTNVLVRVWNMLRSSPYRMAALDFLYEFEERYGYFITQSDLDKVKNYLMVMRPREEGKVYLILSAPYVMAAKLYRLLYKNGGEMLCEIVENAFDQHYGEKMDLAAYGIGSVGELTAHFSFLFVLSGYKRKPTLGLNKRLAEHKIPLPAQYMSNNSFGEKNTRTELLQWPLPSAYELVSNGRNGITPPKPDTPPPEMVSKIECTNHAIKNFGKNLLKIKKDTRGVALGARKLLTQNKINTLSSMAQKCIYANGHGDIDCLKEDLRNVIKHTFGNHETCKGYLCDHSENPWTSWMTPTKAESPNITLHLPEMQTPELLGNTSSLISPTRNLLSAHSHPLGAVIPMICAPDPAQVPLPDKLLAKGCDDSHDSGVATNSKLDNTHSDNESDTWLDKKYSFFNHRA